MLSGRLGPAATFATAEHFYLQTARSITVAGSNGRASIYLARPLHQPDRARVHRRDLAAWRSFTRFAAGGFVRSLAITLAAGATVAAAAALIQRRRHRLVLDAYDPDAIDRAAIFVPEPQQAEAA
jgi:hypothetical protein